MRLTTVAEEIGAQVVAPGRAAAADVDCVFAGNAISDILDKATDRTLLVSDRFSFQLLRVAALMDLPGICVAGGAAPPTELVDMANRQGTAVLVSPLDLGETCARLASHLAVQKPSAR